MKLVRVEPGKYKTTDGAYCITEASGKSPPLWLARDASGTVVESDETLRKVRRKLARRIEEASTVDPELVATKLPPRATKIDRHCPRCHAHHYHFSHPLPKKPHRAWIDCAACGHRWLGRLTREEQGLED
jgi:DNA-directed RNA polymerase subunit M/transcription elongation factor TFIIS